MAAHGPLVAQGSGSVLGRSVVPRSSGGGSLPALCLPPSAPHQEWDWPPAGRRGAK